MRRRTRAELLAAFRAEAMRDIRLTTKCEQEGGAADLARLRRKPRRRRRLPVTR